MSAMNSHAIEWLQRLSKVNIPVLKQTARTLQKLKLDEDDISARNLSIAVLGDPFMVFKILSYANNHMGKRQLQAMVEVEPAILMMGISNFFHNLTPDTIVDDQLKSNLPALTHLLKLIKRAHKAAYYAADWAAIRKDLHSEEVWVAALLHDFAEMLMWCFAPNEMNHIFEMQKKDKTLRTVTAQELILGFHMSDLQRALIKIHHMPPLLLNLMDDDGKNEMDVRTTNVSLAVNLARHSANGWDDAALPDDYAAIAKFLRVDVERVLFIIKHPDAQTI